MVKFARKFFALLSILAIVSGFIFGFSGKADAQDANFLVETFEDQDEIEVNDCVEIIQSYLQESNTTTTPSPTQDNTGDVDLDGAEFTTYPPLECITEDLPYLDITFHNLRIGTGGYHLCTGSTRCFEEDIEQPGRLIELGEQIVENGESITVRVCGDGENKVKVLGTTKERRANVNVPLFGNINPIADELARDENVNCNNDWFWGGNAYIMSIGTKDGDIFNPIKGGGFYVSRSYPDVLISPNANLTLDTVGSGISITLSGEPRPGGENRNNYQITMTGPGDYQAEGCTVLNKKEAFTDINELGTYTIRVKERVNEPSTGSATSGIIQIGAGSLNPLGGLINIGKSIFGRGPGDQVVQNINRCQGGFTYYQIVCTITTDEGEGSCTDPEESKDPEGSEYRSFLRELTALNSIMGVGLSFPCGDGNRENAKRLGSCLSINTALGPIDVRPTEFIKDIFSFILTLASFGAVIVIIYAGFVFMTSRGDKEKIQGARETITAAVVGLLFIIFSLVILEIIGVDILAIPGFER